LLRIDEEETGQLSPAASEQLLDKLASDLDGIAVLIVSDYDKGVVHPWLASRMLDLCNARGVDVVVDTKPANAGLFAGARLIKPNLGEALRIAGHEGNFEPSAAAMRQICEQVIAASGVREVLVTAGVHGVYGLGADGYFNVPGHPRDVYDVAGAGDSVVAGVGLALAAGASLLEAAELGNLAGSLAVGKLGIAAITAAEIAEEVQQLQSAGGQHGAA
jgi:D-beta-D-heptose 7-phosphate kinase/D-beta-D-heptose 1-phosphate adenosyltransferase